jgi:hypothetical protein
MDQMTKEKDTQWRLKTIAEAADSLLKTLNLILPSGKEKGLAFSKLVECEAWARKAVNEEAYPRKSIEGEI